MHSRRSFRRAAVGGAALALLGALGFAFLGPDTSGPDATTAVPSGVVLPVAEGETTDGARRDSPFAMTDPALPAGPEVVGVTGTASEPVSVGTTTAADASTPPTDPSAANGVTATGSGTSLSSGALDFSLDERDLTAADTGVDAPEVVVPTSYPVTDAAKYFVPREERRPGNLGGPPPLDFPGGPGDPAGGFEPPAAPGG